MKRISDFRSEEGQALLEWVILMVPLILLMLIPIELAQRRQARLVALGAARYAAWDHAVNGGTPTLSTTQGAGGIVDEYLSGIGAEVQTLNSDSADSSETLGTFETVMNLATMLLRDGFLDLPSDETLKTVELDVAYDSELGGILGNLVSVMGGAGTSDQRSVSLSGFKGVAVGDPWFPGFENDHKLNTDEAVEDIRDRAWAISGLGTLFEAVVQAKAAVGDIAGTISTALINFYFGQKDHFNYEDRSGHEAWWDPYGSVLLDRIPEPD